MMNLTVCVDANLALKLVFREHDSDLARMLWEKWNKQDARVIAPALWGYEVTSVLRNRIHRGKLPPELGAEAYTLLHNLPVELLQPPGLHRRAWELANQFNRTAAYDTHYLALAEMAGCPFWTADERLFKVVQAELEWVYLLGDDRGVRA